ncbi:hypothetical protein PV328_002611 [Microctonus aethiopoides]|uniref:Reverse transcriptase domain-containing protein n=1 Tax=Microctonus aethiopoides TaxID=144406 RepID=A0AA39F6N2_9HYME|nr:hypothetical protein PV328_002611 [Microctonus aethiopoides]
MAQSVEHQTLWDGNETSDTTLYIKEGLQQGTATSPILFNIFNADTINLFELNNNNDTYSIAFADDLIVYVADHVYDTERMAAVNGSTVKNNESNIISIFSHFRLPIGGQGIDE